MEGWDELPMETDFDLTSGGWGATLRSAEPKLLWGCEQ